MKKEKSQLIPQKYQKEKKKKKNPQENIINYCMPINLTT